MVNPEKNVLKRVRKRVPEQAQVMLLGEYGSTAHGVSLEATDHDFIGIAIEPKSAVFGLDSYEHTMLKDGSPGAPSSAGDSEGTIYALKKFFRLAEAGNTALASLLYLPHYTIMEPSGELLLSQRELFNSTKVLKRFAGHLTRERRRMDGELAEKVLRPELVQRYGYDTKAAYQALKLAFHGRRFATEGRLIIPFPAQEREYILSVRRGEVSKQELKESLMETIDFLDYEAGHSTLLPHETRRDELNELLAELYERAFAFK